MDTHEAFDVRRQNLRTLIRERFDGVNAALCRATGKNANLINLILSNNESIRRNMGEKLAREIEVSLGLPAGWMDTPREGGPVDRVTTVPIVRLDALDKAGVEKVVLGQDVVGRHLERATATNALRIVYATDNEMAPAIEDGDLLYVDTGVTEFDRPGVYVITRGSAVYIRRVTRPLTGGVRIAADADAHSAVDAEPGQFGCSGRIVGAMRFVKI